MSALAWLFGLGALAVAFPILFHLIRRTPTGQTEFSSLMFLRTSPPTLTKRSRLENLLLLFLRGAAIGLIAFAFMRPFFRGADSTASFEVANRRVAILLDTSASMKRSDLWEQAIERVEQVLDSTEVDDDVALITFADSVNVEVPFRDGGMDLPFQRKAIKAKTKELKPGWARSNLGQALVTTADQLDVWLDANKQSGDGNTSRLQIVLISDLQNGSHLETLQSYQWPGTVYVKIENVTPGDPSNATVQLLNSNIENDGDAIRVRVSNSEDSTLEQFNVRWKSSSAPDDTNDSNSSTPFYVSQGTNQVLKLDPEDVVDTEVFTLEGDNEPFDNQYFVVPIQQQEWKVAYFGNDDRDDPENLLFYLSRAAIETPGRKVIVEQVAASPPKDFVLSIVSEPVSSDHALVIDDSLSNGGTLLVVLKDEATVRATESWTGVEYMAPTAASRDYAMLADVAFAHPLFRPFANPRYNDFTQIRFWSHQSVNVINSDVEVIASFDNDEPAIWHRKVSGGGEVYVFASGWSPSQSQLAVSTKFVPLINGLIDLAVDAPVLDKSLLVGETIEFPKTNDPTSPRTMVKPDGVLEVIAADQTRFTETDLPGIYQLTSKDGLNYSFALNMDRAESDSRTIAAEQLEMFEVKLGDQPTASEELAQMREMRDREIENQQKFWKWLIVGAILLLLGETWLASRTESKSFPVADSMVESGTSLGRG